MMNYQTDSFKLDVQTSFTNDGLIKQTTEIGGQIIRTVINTQDEQIRNALIGLGWTPPEQERNNGQT